MKSGYQKETFQIKRQNQTNLKGKHNGVNVQAKPITAFQQNTLPPTDT